MIYPMVPFVILSDLNLDFKVSVIFRPIDALNVLCAQLTRDLFALANFLLMISTWSKCLTSLWLGNVI